MADYRFDTLTQEEIAWGKLKVVVSLVQEMSDYFGNGEFSPVRGGLNIKTTTYINGAKDWATAGVKELHKPQIIQGMKIVAQVGKIGLTQERVEQITEATNAVKQHPAWQAKVAAENAADNAAYEYEQHRKAVDDMMTLGGKTY